MFERMSQRERFLALLIACMLPMLAAFAYFWWVYGSYQNNRLEIRSLRSRISDEEGREMQLMQAAQRRDWYRQVSLPADVDAAKTQYMSFLYDLGQRCLDYEGFTPKFRQERPIKFRNRNEVAVQLTYDALFDANYDQVISFLYEFHRVKLLHRISSLSLTAINSAKNEPTGVLRVRLTIDALVMLDAELERQFRDQLRDTLRGGRDLAFYQDKLLERNIFSGPNLAPEITTRTSHEFKEGESVVIGMQADDANEDQAVEWELLDTGSQLAQAKLTPAAGKNSIRFDAGRLPPDRYEFTVLARDNGFPRKETTKKFVVRVEEEKPEEPADEPPPLPPPFQHAKGTRITALVQGTDGQPQVWIDTKTLPDEPVYFLRSGDEFELDDDTWRIVSIDLPDAVTIQRGESTYQYHSGDTLFVESMGTSIETSSHAEDGSLESTDEQPDDERSDAAGQEDEGGNVESNDDGDVDAEAPAASPNPANPAAD